jgi:hypothetical protein
MVLVESVHENKRVVIQGEALRRRDGAQGKPIPPPREDMKASDNADLPTATASAARGTGAAPLGACAATLYTAESGQREWSTEYYEDKFKKRQAGSRGGSFNCLVSSRRWRW